MTRERRIGLLLGFLLFALAAAGSFAAFRILAERSAADAPSDNAAPPSPAQ